MINLTNLKRIEIKNEEIDILYDHLRKFGKKGFEGVALWSGELHEDIFKVQNTIIPAQKSYRSDFGLHYLVDGNELYRINVWLYKNKQTLIAQIHSHPNEAFHSEVDDEHAMVTKTGSISIVIPNFGFDDISLKHWAVFQLSPNRDWIEFDSKKIDEFFLIT